MGENWHQSRIYKEAGRYPLQNQGTPYVCISHRPDGVPRTSAPATEPSRNSHSDWRGGGGVERGFLAGQSACWLPSPVGIPTQISR